MEVRGEVSAPQDFLQRVSVREVWSSHGSLVVNPSGEEPSWESVHAHPRDVSGPSKVTRGEVVVQCFDAEALQEVVRGDAVLDHLPLGDLAHHADTLVVE